MNKLLRLESLRGFAAVYVVLHHLFSNSLYTKGKYVSFLFKFGQEAVILFFFLSGFVIYYSFFKGRDKTFKTFFLKRFLRIYIPLICVFLLNYIIVSKEITAFNWKSLLGNLLMLQDVSSLKPNVIVDTFLYNNPLWSLSYEWWFYMLFIFIINLKNKNLSNTIYTVGILAAIFYILSPNFFNRELMYFTIWWCGCYMAKLYIENEDLSFKNMRISLLTLLVITLILTTKLLSYNGTATIGISPYLEIRHFCFATFSLTVAILWNKFKWVGFNQIFGIFHFIAPISFGIYISHWFLIVEAHYFDNIIKNAFLRIVSYIGVCVFFSYFIERMVYPFVNKKLNIIICKCTNKV